MKYVLIVILIIVIIVAAYVYTTYGGKPITEIPAWVLMFFGK